MREILKIIICAGLIGIPIGVLIALLTIRYIIK
jgi:ethanolamine transporter EutH